MGVGRDLPGVARDFRWSGRCFGGAALDVPSSGAGFSEEWRWKDSCKCGLTIS